MKIKSLTPHKPRHTFGTELVSRGVSVRTIQALMGHSNLNTTAGYLGVASRELFEAVEKLES